MCAGCKTVEREGNSTAGVRIKNRSKIVIQHHGIGTVIIEYCLYFMAYSQSKAVDSIGIRQINKQDGSPWLADGATAPDGDLLGMGFYVEGIVGDIPQ